MTNEEIKREFERWIDTGRPLVWIKNLNNPTSEWITISNPTWREKITYIVDNQYAEIRKAFYDGKTIQFKIYNEERPWVDWGSEEEPDYKCYYDIRIKPKEPVYEYQWIGQFDNGQYRLTEEWYTKNERCLVEQAYNNLKNWDVFLPSKRERK